jgi:hypothetical protein
VGVRGCFTLNGDIGPFKDKGGFLVKLCDNSIDLRGVSVFEVKFMGSVIDRK